MTESTATIEKPFLERFVTFWQLVRVKIWFNLRSEASQSYLSYAWWILEPLLLVGVFFIVFDIFLIFTVIIQVHV